MPQQRSNGFEVTINRGVGPTLDERRDFEALRELPSFILTMSRKLLSDSHILLSSCSIGPSNAVLNLRKSGGMLISCGASIFHYWRLSVPAR